MLIMREATLQIHLRFELKKKYHVFNDKNSIECKSGRQKFLVRYINLFFQIKAVAASITS